MPVDINGMDLTACGFGPRKDRIGDGLIPGVIRPRPGFDGSRNHSEIWVDFRKPPAGLADCFSLIGSGLNDPVYFKTPDDVFTKNIDHFYEPFLSSDATFYTLRQEESIAF